MNSKTRITDAHNYGDKQVVVYRNEAFEQEAEFAFALIEKWGVVAAEPDGEDSAGRARLRLSSPEELVARAFSIARLAVQAARDAGLAFSVPDLNEVNAEIDAERAETKAKRDSNKTASRVPA